MPHCLDQGVAITQLVAYCLQLSVCGEGSKEEGSLLLDEESMGYEWVDEPGFASLSVHSILHLASLLSDEWVVWCMLIILSLICLRDMTGLEVYTGRG